MEIIFMDAHQSQSNKWTERIILVPTEQCHAQILQLLDLHILKELVLYMLKKHVKNP